MYGSRFLNQQMWAGFTMLPNLERVRRNLYQIEMVPQRSIGPSTRSRCYRRRMISMAATSRACEMPAACRMPAREAESAVAAAGRSVARRRRISPQAGRALEVLGHAIEYLTDEFVCAGGSVSAYDAQVEAVQLLMCLNREIYLGCPEAPTLGDRLRALLPVRTARSGIERTANSR